MKKIIVHGLLILFLSTIAAISNAAHANLIKNGDFESFDKSRKASGWVIDAWKGTSTLGVTDKRSHSGKYSAFIQSDDENDARIIQSIKVVPNTIYKLSGFVAAQNIPEGKIGGTLCIMGGFSRSQDIKSGNDWQPIEFIFKTANDQKELAIGARLGFFGSATVGTAFFDDLVLLKETNQSAAVPQLGADAVNFKITVQNEKLTVKAPTLQAISFQQKASAQASKFFNYPTLIVAFYAFLLILVINFKKKTRFNINFGMGFLILAAVNFIIRMPLLPSAPFAGDLGFFELWSVKMAELGASNFYALVPTDYPPFSLYIFGIVGVAAKILSIGGNAVPMNSLVKVPAFLFDIGTAWLLFKLFEKKNKTLGFILSGIYMFVPAIIYNSSYWGQSDSFYTFFLVLAFYFIYKKRVEFASGSLVIALLMKTQTIAAIPLFIFYLILNCNIKKLAKIAAMSISFFFIIFLPFAVKMPFNWIFTFYTKQAGDFPYATLNSGNLMMLLNGNFVVDSTNAFWGINYHQLGIFLFFISAAWACWFYYKKRTLQSLAVGFAFCAFSFFMVFPRVHERYLFPAFVFLFLTIGYYKDRKLLYLTAIASLAYLLNLNAVIVKYQNLMVEPIFSRVLYILALINMAFLGYFIFWMYAKLVKNSSGLKVFIKNYKEKLQSSLTGKLREKPFAMINKDYIAVFLIALAYCIFIFLNLGSINTPHTGLDMASSQNTVEVEFINPTNLSSISWYDGYGTGQLSVDIFENEKWTGFATLSCNNYFALNQTNVEPRVVTKIKIVPKPSAGHVNEIAFFDNNNKIIRIKSPSANPLFDEQNRMLISPSYMNSAYFDEIYHGRTAYEFTKGYPIYETTHPPLGKDILSLGILMFGMNPFGTRFMHAFAGLLLIVTLFFFGREILATRFGAYSSMLLGVFDFMPFVQSRYASIDTFSVLFILLMYLFTFKYIRLIKDKSGGSLLIPILIVISFALGIAVKWTALYGFFGVIACIVLASEKKDLLRRFGVFSIILLFIAPIIYYLSYLPVLKTNKIPAFTAASVQSVIKSQGDMYDYHSKLKAGHPFSSSYWSWPFNFKPLWLYPDKPAPVKPGNKVSIVSMGNPIIWLFAACSFFILLYKLLAIRKLTILHFVLIGFFALYLPWVLVSRATFIYHFYPCLPFYLIFVSLVLEPLWNIKEGRDYIYLFFGLCLLFLILFYPVLSGMEVSQNYINHLHWFPADWVF